MWTEKFHMYILGLEKAEEPEIKLPTFTGSWRKQGNSRKTSTTASLTMLKPFSIMCITTNCGKSLKGWKNQASILVPWEIHEVRHEHGTTDWFKIGKGVQQTCILSPCLFNLYAEYIMWNTRLYESKAGRNHNCQENINNLRQADEVRTKRRGTKEPLGVDRRGEWKSCPKTQNSKN